MVSVFHFVGFEWTQFLQVHDIEIGLILLPDFNDENTLKTVAWAFLKERPFRNVHITFQMKCSFD